MKKRSKSLKRKSRKRSRSKSKKSKGCFMSSKTKYMTRPGPPFPAQDCKNYRKLGNDGYFYVSKPDKNKIYRWVKIKERWNIL